MALKIKHKTDDSIEQGERVNFSGGLRAPHFKKIASNGFGDPLNAYPHSMQWFKNRLYVGTTRANLQLLWFAAGEAVKYFKMWPVEHPDEPYNQDIRAHIWQYDPVSKHWENVYISPMIMGSEGFEVPLALGFRGMVTHQGPKDPTPALYFPTWSTRLGPGPVLIRSYDGKDFEAISEPGLGDPTVTTIRSIVSFKGKLFLSPTGTTKNRYSANLPDRLVIFVNRDPSSSDWELAAEPFFGDPANLGVFSMAVYNNHLYAGTANADQGFQLWKTDAEGKPPYRWLKVMHHGGYRGKENEGVVSMAEFNGKLYVGTGIIGGYDRERNVGPASPELFSVEPDDSWELIVGEPRITPEGLKIPLSGFGAGFNSLTAGYFWYLCNHDGWLYLGTYDFSVWLSFFRPDTWPRSLQRYVDMHGIDKIVRNWAGFDLWRSRDGVKWIPVTRNGFGNPYNYGIRTMASTPFGLFIGVANPFAPTVAVRGPSGWRYVPNAKGGLEIWHGADIRDEGIGREKEERAPKRFVKTKEPGPLSEECERLLDRYYGKSGFRHCGLWQHETKNPAMACDDLVDEVVSFLSQETRRILEIGCGKGATSRAILDRLPNSTLIGTVRTKEDLKSCKWKAPEAIFFRIKGPRLKTLRSAFDAVISIEGLKQFGNPKKLFKEIHRMLAPGGDLIFTEFIFDSAIQDKGVKVRNIAESLAELEMQLADTGFLKVKTYDMTYSSWRELQKHFHGEFSPKLFSTEINQELFELLLENLPNKNCPVAAYFLCRATKGAPET